jgi:hypothetical protein
MTGTGHVYEGFCVGLPVSRVTMCHRVTHRREPRFSDASPGDVVTGCDVTKPIFAYIARAHKTEIRNVMTPSVTRHPGIGRGLTVDHVMDDREIGKLRVAAEGAS